MWRIAEPYFDYEVNENGEVRNAKTKKLLSQCTTKKGYKRVGLFVNGKNKNVFVHRLVATAFIENNDPEHKTQVNHINENKGDNRYLNLEWVTPSENQRHGTGIARRTAKRLIPVVMKYKGLTVSFDSADDASKRTGLSKSGIQKCCEGIQAGINGAEFSYGFVDFELVPKHPRICPVCGTPFNANWHTRKYCSDECYAKERQRRYGIGQDGGDAE